MKNYEEILNESAEELIQDFPDNPKIQMAAEKVMYLMLGGSIEEANLRWPELAHNEVW